MRNVVLVAFEALPNVGTEAGMAWNWATAYRRAGFTTVVVTQRGNVSDATHRAWSEIGVSLVGVGPDSAHGAPVGLARMVSTYIGYARWIRAVSEWFAETGHDGWVHHLSLSSVRLPFATAPAASRYIIGPLGGGHLGLLAGIPIRYMPSEIARNATVRMARRSFARNIRYLHLRPTVLATNHDTASIISAESVAGAQLCLSDGIEELPRQCLRKLQPEISLLWAGRLVGTKRPDIAIRLVKALRDAEVEVTLRLAGTGPERERLERLAKRLKVRDEVRFMGAVEWSEMEALYRKSDYLVFTSMRDSSCPAVLEAASFGLPTLALRVQGVGSLVPANVARGPERFLGARELVDDLAGIVLMDARDVKRYDESVEAALEFAALCTWSAKFEILGESAGLVANVPSAPEMGVECSR